VKTFGLFRGKMKTKLKYGNINGILQSRNENRIFLVEVETETEQRFLVE
jgi:hypothetical protein